MTEAELFRLYIRRRYGGLPEHLKPPLGWPPWYRPGLGLRLGYYFRFNLWRVEKVVYGWVR